MNNLRRTVSREDALRSESLLNFLCDISGPEYKDSSGIVILAAHPDDEVIGLGAQIPRLRHATFIHVTDGAPVNMQDALGLGFDSRKGYAEARRNELLDALNIAGIQCASCLMMNFRDQETSFHMKELAVNLFHTLRDLNPEFVITHPYEGGHQDHDATAFALHMACSMLQSLNMPYPAVIEFSSYHSENGAFKACRFLDDNSVKPVYIDLPEDSRELKRKMFNCFTTQQNVLKGFPLEIECFRAAPVYDFNSPPHMGKLYYENFNWGMDGYSWRKLASKTEEDLKFYLTSGFDIRNDLRR